MNKYQHIQTTQTNNVATLKNNEKPSIQRKAHRCLWRGNNRVKLLFTKSKQCCNIVENNSKTTIQNKFRQKRIKNGLNIVEFFFKEL